MSSAPSSPPEVLIARKIPWRKRLWVRVLLLLLLLHLVCAVIWWWPRRTMVAVWRAGGTVTCDQDRERTIKLLQWWEPSGWGWGWQNFGLVLRMLSAFRTDQEITWAGLHDTRVDDRWLSRISRCQKLKGISLNGRHVTSGLDELRDLAWLSKVNIKSPSSGCLVELRRLPHLEDLSITDAEPGELGLEVLSSLPKLKSLFIGNCRNTDQILRQIPELPNLEVLILQDCHDFSDEDLAFLQRLPNVKYIDLVKSSPISDEGLSHLAELTKLETLCIRKSSGRITDAGLQSLGRLVQLKELIVLNGDLTAEQLKTLQNILPQAKITVN